VKPTDIPAPFQVSVSDFLSTWPIGRCLEHKQTMMRVEIGEAGESGFWVYALNKQGHRAQRSVRGAPRAFRLYPLIACSEWVYTTPRSPRGMVPA